MRTSSEVLLAINELERRFPVNAWCAGDIDLWPTYRVRLYTNVTSGFLLSERKTGSVGRIMQLGRRAFRMLLRVPLAAIRDHRNNASPMSGTTAVFLSDGMSFVQLSGQWFDRIVDPLIEMLDRRGLRSLKLTPLAEAHVPRYAPSRFVQPQIDRLKLLPPSKQITAYLPEFEQFLVAAREVFGSHAPDRGWLVNQALRIDALAYWFGGVLSQTEASYAFVNTYYSLEGMAFIQAARRLNLVSVDLQHGMQGAHHVAYAKWENVPAVGYSTLPDEFWVWSREEADAIGAWCGTRSTNLPRITGNLWLERWRKVSNQVIAHYIRRANEMRAPLPSRTQVLVCLSWGLDEEETDKLLEAAVLTGPKVSWWWRLHPVERGRCSEFSAVLSRRGLDGSLVSAATDMPLPALIRAADVLVAHSSTAIQEAAQFGVPSVITSAYGAELHAELVRQVTAFVATTPQDIASAVIALSGRSRQQSMHDAEERPDIDALIDEVMLPTVKKSSTHQTDTI